MGELLFLLVRSLSTSLEQVVGTYLLISDCPRLDTNRLGFQVRRRQINKLHSCRVCPSRPPYDVPK